MGTGRRFVAMVGYMRGSGKPSLNMEMAWKR
jgi:hypothetical protein